MQRRQQQQFVMPFGQEFHSVGRWEAFSLLLVLVVVVVVVVVMVLLLLLISLPRLLQNDFEKREVPTRAWQAVDERPVRCATGRSYVREEAGQSVCCTSSSQESENTG